MSDLSKEMVAELLLDNVSEELCAQYVALAGILTDSGYESHIDELEALYVDYDSQIIDSIELPTHVESILLNALDTVMNMCGVKLMPDLDIDTRVEIARALLTYDMVEEPEHLYNKLENISSDLEGLCKVLHYVTGLDMDILFASFEEVSPGIIDKLKVMIRDNLKALREGSTEQDSPVSDILRARYERLTALKPDSIGGKTAADIDPTDLSLESLYAMHLIPLMKMPIEQAVDNLYSLSVLNGNSFESNSQMIDACLDDLFYTLDDRTKAGQVKLSLESQYAAIYGDLHEEV